MQSVEKGVVKSLLCMSEVNKSAALNLGIIQDGRTPAIIFSLPQNESKLISLDSKTATSMVSRHFHCDSAGHVAAFINCILLLQVRVHGRMGLVAQRYNVQLGDEHLPVLVRMKHVTCFGSVAVLCVCSLMQRCAAATGDTHQFSQQHGGEHHLHALSA